MLYTSFIIFSVLAYVKSSPILKNNYTSTTLAPAVEETSGLTDSQIITISLGVPGAIAAIIAIVATIFAIIKAIKKSRKKGILRNCCKGSEDATDGSGVYQEVRMSDRGQKMPNLDLDDRFEEKHFKWVIKEHLSRNTILKMFPYLKGLSDSEITQRLNPNLDGIPLQKQAENVLEAWIKENGPKATRQKVIIACRESDLRNAEEQLEKHWEGHLDEKCKPVKDTKDIFTVGHLNWNEFQEMLHHLGLSMAYISLNRGIETASVYDTTKEVFRYWVGKSKPTIRDLMYSLKMAEDLNAAQEIAKGWNISIEDINNIEV